MMTFVLLLAGCASTPAPPAATPTTPPSTPTVTTRPAYLPSAFRRPAKGPLTLAITFRQRYVADGKPFATDAALRTYLLERQRRARETHVTIVAHPKVPYRSLIRAMDLVRGAGFVNILFKVHER